MNNRLEIFKIFGFPIRVDLSWLIILFLVTSSLAAGFFPANHPGLPVSAYWAMGFVASIGLFLSILFHELSHALVARHYQIQIDGITLFIFGGVAEMRDEPSSPKSEFLMAGVGPLASALLAVVFYLLNEWAHAHEVNRGLVLIFYYLGIMNMLLAAFNLVPAFPLDGGRIFRSILWAIKKDFNWATKISAALGKGFGWMMIAYGIVKAARGNFLGGFWYVLIGFFLKRASEGSENQLTMKRLLEKIPVSQLAKSHFIQLHPYDRLMDLGNVFQQSFLYTHYPVLEGDQFLGFLPLERLQSLTRDRFERSRVSDLLERGHEELVLDPSLNAWEALKKMRQSRANVLFLGMGQSLQGVVTLDDLLGYMGNREAR